MGLQFVVVFALFIISILDQEVKAETTEIWETTQSYESSELDENAISALSNRANSEDIIPCDQGWFLFREKCFKVNGRRKSDKVSWDVAKSNCENMDATLATIQSQEENEFLTTFLLLDAHDVVWIGINDRRNESIYVWDDGSTVNYTNWRVNQPSGIRDGDEDCGEMTFWPERNHVGTWNDAKCDMHFPFICQKKADFRKKSPNSQYCSSEDGGGWKFQDSCYHVVAEKKTWEEAEQHCKNYFNGHLATVLDRMVDMFLNYVLSKYNKELWVGLKLKNGLQQMWSSGFHVAYSGVNEDLGDFINNTCVLRTGYRGYISVPCSDKYSFICEKSKARPPVLKAPKKGSHCPKVPEDWRDLGGEYCYYIETKEEISWFEASFYCKSRGGNLVSIHSKEESDALFRFIRYTRDSLSIGLYRHLQKDDDFVWSDESPVDFQNWKIGEPNNEKHEKCAEVFAYSMKWNDVKCSDRRGFICSVRKVSSNSSDDGNIKIISDISNCKTIAESHDNMSHFYKALIAVAVTICLLINLIGVSFCYYRWFRINALHRQKPNDVALVENSYLENPSHTEPVWMVHSQAMSGPNYEQMN